MTTPTHFLPRKGLTVLAIAPHSDDVELGCCATLMRLLHEYDADIYYRVFSTFALMHEAERLDEARTAASMMGIDIAKQEADPEDRRFCAYNFPDTRFPQYEHEIHTQLVKLKDRIKPDLVFIPSLRDTHQDHQVISNYAVRVFRSGESILHYEIARSLERGFAPSLFVDVSGKMPGQDYSYAERKVQILQEAFLTQKRKPFLTGERIRGTMSMRGMFASPGVDYAEAFETRIGI